MGLKTRSNAESNISLCKSFMNAQYKTVKVHYNIQQCFTCYCHHFKTIACWFLLENVNGRLYFISFLYIETENTVDFFPRGRQVPTYLTEWKPLPPMSSGRQEPGHLQWWYWPSSVGIFRLLHMNSNDENRADNTFNDIFLVKDLSSLIALNTVECFSTPADAGRKNDVIITSKWRRDVVLA